MAGPAVAALIAALVSCSADAGSVSNETRPVTPPETVVASPDGSAVVEPSRPSDPTRPVVTEPVDRDSDAALIDAAWNDDVALATELIAAGRDVNAKDSTQQSAYLIATSEGYLELLDLTLRNGADVDALDGFNGTGLIRAAERGHAAVVGRLLQTGIDVNHINNLGWTALHEAIILGDGSDRYVETIQLLIAGGADVELPSQRDGATPFELARGHGQENVATIIDAALAAASDDADSALRAAAESGDTTGAAIALATGADIETRDSNDRTPLLLAATHDHTQLARLLVALGADPDSLDERHDTPWLVTGVTGSVEMAEILLAAEPDLGILNRFGGTSLIPASERGHVDYVRRVVQTDIDIDHVNDPGWTALMETVLLGDGSQRHQDIVWILLDAGADPTIADHNGVTPAEHAVAGGFDDIARILAER